MHRLGIRIPVGDTLKHIRMKFAFCISDEKAEKECLGVKGAAGTNMCVSCQNCVRVPEDNLPEGSPWVHYSCTDMTKFIPQTVESFQVHTIHLHSRDLLLWQENHQYLVGGAECCIRDMNMHHVVLVWRYTKVGNAWSPLGARLVALPLRAVIAPMAYTTVQDNLVLALPPAWL